MANSVHHQFFNSQLSSPSTKPFTFINVGNIEHNKGTDLLLKSFAKCFRNSDVNLKLIGTGPNIKMYQHLADQLGIEKQVYFLGKKGREEIIRELQRTHVFISTSRVETFGVAIVEALAMGLPVISTKSGGPEFILREKYLGLLTEVDHLESISQAMVKVKNEYDTYSQKDIRNYCLLNFSEEILTKKVVNIYEKILPYSKYQLGNPI